MRTVTARLGINDGNWHHVVGTVDAAGMQLFVDGTRVARDQRYTSPRSYAGYWRLGSDTTTSFANKPSDAALAGSIDEVAVTPRALSLAEVQSHYTASGRVGSWTAQPTRRLRAVACWPTRPICTGGWTSPPATRWTRPRPATTATSPQPASPGRCRGRRRRRLRRHLQRQQRPGRRPAGLGGADAVHRRGVVQDQHHQGRQADRFRQHHERAQLVLRPARVHAEHRQAGLRRQQRQPADHHQPARLQRQPVAPGGSHPGRRRHEALRRRPAGRHQRRPPAPRRTPGYWRDRRRHVWSGATSKYFAGSLDEAAVYPNALSENDVRAHYTRVRPDRAQPGPGGGVHRDQVVHDGERGRVHVRRSGRTAGHLCMELRRRQHRDRRDGEPHLHHPGQLHHHPDGDRPTGPDEHRDAHVHRGAQRGADRCLRLDGDAA